MNATCASEKSCACMHDAWVCEGSAHATAPAQQHIAQRVVSNLLMVMVAFAFCIGVYGCAQTNEQANQTNNQTTSANSSEAMHRISVLQLVPHPSLDQTYQGFLQGLKERGYVEDQNLELDYNNAQGDVNNATTIAQKIAANQPELVLSIATQAAQALRTQAPNIPMVFTAVTDPVQAGLVESLDAPGTNVTGTSDATPASEQVSLLQQLKPEATRVGIIYNSSEDNSVVQVEEAKKAFADVGISVVELSVSKADEIITVLQNSLGSIDALYAPTDNLVASNISAITALTNPAKVPLIVAFESALEEGALATKGINFFELGKQTGDIAADILEGKNPADIPVQLQKVYSVKINKSVAEELGITIPADLETLHFSQSNS